jgi:hypothetical protein
MSNEIKNEKVNQLETIMYSSLFSSFICLTISPYYEPIYNFDNYNQLKEGLYKPYRPMFHWILIIFSCFIAIINNLSMGLNYDFSIIKKKYLYATFFKYKLINTFLKK